MSDTPGERVHPHDPSVCRGMSTGPGRASASRLSMSLKPWTISQARADDTEGLHTWSSPSGAGVTAAAAASRGEPRASSRRAAVPSRWAGVARPCPRGRGPPYVPERPGGCAPGSRRVGAGRVLRVSMRHLRTWRVAIDRRLPIPSAASGRERTPGAAQGPQPCACAGVRLSCVLKCTPARFALATSRCARPAVPSQIGQ
jgi:hypothetical protein